MDKHPLVMFNEGFYVNRVVNAGFEKAGIAPNIVLLTGQINTIKRFVHENIASTFLIKNCVTKDDKLAMVPLKTPVPVTVGLGWKAERHLYSDVVKFIDFISKSRL